MSVSRDRNIQSATTALHKFGELEEAALQLHDLLLLLCKDGSNLLSECSEGLRLHSCYTSHHAKPVVASGSAVQQLVVGAKNRLGEAGVVVISILHRDLSGVQSLQAKQSNH